MLVTGRVHDESLKIPLLLENLIQQNFVFRTVGAVDAVICGHDRADAAFLHGSANAGR